MHKKSSCMVCTPLFVCVCLRGGGRGGLLKRSAPFSYLNHSFILSLNGKVCIRFLFLQISLCFFLSKVMLDERFVDQLHLCFFCFQSEGGVQSLRNREGERAGGLKILRLRGLPILFFCFFLGEGRYFCWGVTPLHAIS